MNFKKYIKPVIALIVIILFFVGYYKYVKIKNEIKEMRNHYDEILFEKSIEASSLKDYFEEGDLKNYLSKVDNESQYHIFLFVRVSHCNKCFIFHLDNLKKLNEVSKIVFAPRDGKFISSQLDSKSVKLIAGKKQSELFQKISKDFLIYFVDKELNIIFCDIPNPHKLDESKKFYEKIDLILN